MARHGRYFLPDQPLHVIQRGNNRSAILRGLEGSSYLLDMPSVLNYVSSTLSARVLIPF